MVVAAEFGVERKKFWLERDDDTWRIGEQVKGFVVKIRLSNEAMGWLRQKLGLLSKGVAKIGFFSSIKTPYEDLVLTIKENKGGKFLSILCIERMTNRRPRSIYCPFGEKGNGWGIFFRAINECVGSQHRVVTLSKQPKLQSTVEQSFNGRQAFSLSKVNRVDAGLPNLQRIRELRDSAILIEAKDGTADWDCVSVEIQNSLIVPNSDFQLFILSNRKALCEFKTPEFANRLLSRSSWSFAATSFGVRRWSIDAETLSPTVLLSGRRWVKLEGMPLHLWSKDNVTKLCNSFGICTFVDEERSRSDDYTSLWALIDKCNLSSMPQFTMLVEAGVSYPVKFTPQLEMVVSGDVSGAAFASSSHGKSFADVVRVGHLISDNGLERPVSAFSKQGGMRGITSNDVCLNSNLGHSSLQSRSASNEVAGEFNDAVIPASLQDSPIEIAQVGIVGRDLDRVLVEKEVGNSVRIEIGLSNSGKGVTDLETCHRVSGSGNAANEGLDSDSEDQCDTAKGLAIEDSWDAVSNTETDDSSEVESDSFLEESLYSSDFSSSCRHKISSTSESYSKNLERVSDLLPVGEQLGLINDENRERIGKLISNQRNSVRSRKGIPATRLSEGDSVSVDF